MKYARFKKRIFAELALILGALAVLGAIGFFLGTVSGNFDRENEELKRKADSTKADMERLKTKYMSIREDATLYKEVQDKQLHNQLSINRQAVMSQFTQLKTDYLLGNMRLSMSPVQDSSDPAFKRKTSLIDSSDVTVSLDALSDEYVYDMLERIQQELPGVTKFTKLAMQRQQIVTEDVLRSISVRGPQPLIKTEIQFKWFGINPIENSDSDANKKKP